MLDVKGGSTAGRILRCLFVLALAVVLIAAAPAIGGHPASVLVIVAFLSLWLVLPFAAENTGSRPRLFSSIRAPPLA